MLWALVAAAGLGVSTQGCAEPAAGCRVELYYVASAPVSHVSAVGEWNGWDPGSNPLSALGNDVYGAAFELHPGDHLYRLVVDGESILDPLAPLSLYNERLGREDSLLRVRDCEAPRWEVGEVATSSAGRIQVEARFVAGRGGGELDLGSIDARLRSGEAPVTVSQGGDGSTVVLTADGLEHGKHTFVLSGRSRDGVATERLVAPLWTEDEPLEWSDMVIYQVVTDRFALSGEPLDQGLAPQEAITRRHGGDLPGLTAVVESGYFDELGVTALWISAANDNPEGLFEGHDGHLYQGYHGYWASAPREVEPVIGGEQALRDLVDAAHRRSVRVIMDTAPNHVHVEHPYYTERSDDGWFNGDGDCVCGVSCSWGEDIERCWFTSYLADLNWHHRPVVDQIVSDTMFWLETFDLDGLRIDAVPMMPRLATRHLSAAVREGLEAGPTDVYLLGETYTGPGGQIEIAQYIGPFGLDGQFDFPVMWAIRDAIGRGTSSMATLEQVIRESERTWRGSGAVMAPILGNHDVARFLSVAAGTDMSDPWRRPPGAPDADEPYARLLIAHAVVLTLPGAPVIYYGDEIGMPGASDPDNRRPMRFDDDLEPREAAVLEAVRRLGRARRCSLALRRGERAALFVTDDLYAYARDAGDGLPAIVMLNRLDRPRSITVDLPPGATSEPFLPLVDVLAGIRTDAIEGRIGPLTIPSLRAMVLVPVHGGCASP